MQVEILRSAIELRRISPAIRSFAAEILHADVTYLPDYFLPRMAATSRPRVVICYEQEAMVGVVYTHERWLLGVGTGWLHGGDAMGRGLVLSSPERELEVLSAACDCLLRNGAHALRLLWSSGGDETRNLQLEQPRLQVSYRLETPPEGDWLRLAPDYETFLGQLGRHTRRNLRHYRRKAEEAGFTFVPELSVRRYESAIASLNPVSRFPSFRERELRDRRFFKHFGTPVLAGLADGSGRLVSVLGGVRSGDHLHVLTQLNDESDSRFSVSLVLRGYLIEHLIARGTAAIHFVNGASPMLGRFCEPVKVRIIAIDRRRSPLHPLKVTGAFVARRWQQNGRETPLRMRGLLGSYLEAGSSQSPAASL
jgi:Acetyltransferase (GNAT) domain